MGDLPPDYLFHKGGMINLTCYCPHTMLGRMAEPTDLGGSVILLLSDASLYVAGLNLPVDGGYTAK